MKNPTTASVSQSKSSKVKQPTVDKFFTSDKLVINMTKKTFKESIVGMVVKEGLPFRFFKSSSFKIMCGEIATKLSVSLDDKSIRKYVMDTAKDLKDQLKVRVQ